MVAIDQSHQTGPSDQSEKCRHSGEGFRETEFFINLFLTLRKEVML